MVSPVAPSISRSGHRRWASRRASGESRPVRASRNQGTSPESMAAGSRSTGSRKGMRSNLGSARPDGAHTDERKVQRERLRKIGGDAKILRQRYRAEAQVAIEDPPRGKHTR